MKYVDTWMKSMDFRGPKKLGKTMRQECTVWCN
jgi:hypothetical protein